MDWGWILFFYTLEPLNIQLGFQFALQLVSESSKFIFPVAYLQSLLVTTFPDPMSQKVVGLKPHRVYNICNLYYYIQRVIFIFLDQNGSCILIFRG